MDNGQVVKRISVSFVTGFLGSGKTTLIASLLQQPDMSGTAIVVNEFGAVGLDDAILAQTTGDNPVALLANGCMCCVADDELSATLLKLTQRTKPRPNRIIIETTGLADPTNLLHKIMADPRLRPLVRLDAVITTVDAVNGLQNLHDTPVARRQAAMADRRLVTKSDLADHCAVECLENELRTLNAGSDILRVNHGDIAAHKLFGTSLIDSKTGRADVGRWLNAAAHRTGAGHTPAHSESGHAQTHFSGSHGEGMGTWLIEAGRPTDWERLSPRMGVIITRYGDLLLRLKGVIWTTGDNRPLVINGVQRIFHTPIRLEKWPGPPRTALVAIGGEGARAAVEMMQSALDDLS